MVRNPRKSGVSALRDSGSRGSSAAGCQRKCQLDADNADRAELPRYDRRVMAQMSMTAGVSFAKTPAIEVSKKAGKIEKLGWREVGRGDPWVISYRKDVPMHTADPEAEI